MVGARLHLAQGRPAPDPARQRARRRQGRGRGPGRSPRVLGFVLRQADPVDRRVKRVYVTRRAKGFLEKLRKETDKFNVKIVNEIDRKQLEAASDALLARKHSDVSAISASDSRVKSSTMARMRKRRPSVIASDRKSRLQR